jgi:hypothetical protein
MKTIKVYKIKIDNQELANDIMDDFTNIVIGDDILNVIFNSISETEDFVFCFLTDDKQEMIFNLFIDYGVLRSHFDITKDVLYQKDTGIVVECLSDIKLIKNFISEFLDSDTVLDKIIELGIDSLNDIDYQVLQNENPQV